MKNSSMQFHLDWYTWCFAFIFEEQYTLAVINLSEGDPGHFQLTILRNTWSEFCKESNTPVPTSNAIMLAVSSKSHRLFLNQAACFQESLVGTSSTEVQASPTTKDGNVVYYRFGGAAICEKRTALRQLRMY